MSSTVVRYPQVQTIRTKVVGVSFSNADGTSRQEIVCRCRAGDRLVLKREPENEHDPLAVAVCTAAGEQLGYIGGHRAHEVAAEIDAGREVSAKITNITGGGGWLVFRRYHGVNIEVALT